MKEDLFSASAIDSKTMTSQERGTSNNGLYKVDLKKADAKKGYVATIRFLPNLQRDMNIGTSYFSKIQHYVRFDGVPELTGLFDSPANFNETCKLSSTYYQLNKSSNAMLKENAKKIQYTRKYYSYIEVLEDKQQPELEGKIMVFRFGKKIMDMIDAQRAGVIDDPCNVFDLTNGKDFVLIAKSTDYNGMPDYSSSSFKSKTSPVSFPNKKGEIKPLPLDKDGKFDAKTKEFIVTKMLERDVELEDYMPKHLTPEEDAKIDKIVSVLTGREDIGRYNKTEYKVTSAADFMKQTPKQEPVQSTNDDIFGEEAGVTTASDDELFGDETEKQGDGEADIFGDW